MTAEHLDHIGDDGRVFGTEEHGTDSRFLTERTARGHVEWSEPEPRTVDDGVFEGLEIGQDPTPTWAPPATIWSAEQVQVGLTPVKIVSEDSRRTQLILTNNDLSAATLWVANGSHVNSAGFGSVNLPIGASLTLKHGCEVWAVLAAGAVSAPVPTGWMPVPVVASAWTQIAPAGVVGTFYYDGNGASTKLSYTSGASGTLSSSTTGASSVTFATPTTGPVYAFSDTTQNINVAYSLATAPAQVMLNVVQEKRR